MGILNSVAVPDGIGSTTLSSVLTLNKSCFSTLSVSVCRVICFPISVIVVPSQLYIFSNTFPTDDAFNAYVGTLWFFVNLFVVPMPYANLSFADHVILLLFVTI